MKIRFENNNAYRLHRRKTVCTLKNGGAIESGIGDGEGRGGAMERCLRKINTIRCWSGECGGCFGFSWWLVLPNTVTPPHRHQTPNTYTNTHHQNEALYLFAIIITLTIMMTKMKMCAQRTGTQHIQIHQHTVCVCGCAKRQTRQSWSRIATTCTRVQANTKTIQSRRYGLALANIRRQIRVVMTREWQNGAVHSQNTNYTILLHITATMEAEAGGEDDDDYSDARAPMTYLQKLQIIKFSV